jgi:hypothetical protein
VPPETHTVAYVALNVFETSVISVAVDVTDIDDEAIVSPPVSHCDQSHV